MNGIWQIAEGKKIKLAPFYQPYMCVYVYLPGIEDIFNKSALYSSAFPLSADTSFRYLFIYLFIFSSFLTVLFRIIKVHGEVNYIFNVTKLSEKSNMSYLRLRWLILRTFSFALQPFDTFFIMADFTFPEEYRFVAITSTFLFMFIPDHIIMKRYMWCLK